MTKYKFIAQNNDPSAINIKQSWGVVLFIDPQIGIKLERR